LAESRLLILPRVQSRVVTERMSNNNKALFYVVLDVEFDFVSATDGTSHTVRVCGEAMDSGDKATNKAMSAAYKYMAMQVFCIPTEGDNDADATTHEVVAADAALTQFAVAIRKAVAAVDADKLYAVHLDLHEEGEDVYRAVWEKLDPKTRATAKEFIAMKKLEPKKEAA
jgi:hypothetical protein